MSHSKIFNIKMILHRPFSALYRWTSLKTRSTKELNEIIKILNDSALPMSESLNFMCIVYQ